MSLNDGARAVYIGDWVETGAAYYHLGGQRVAKRAAGGVTYLHGDHLGSVGKTTGAASSGQLYEAYGAKRGSSEVDTPYRYTGQRWEENDALDIYYYKARWYDPALGRFLQPDPFVPNPNDPQTLNRYAYCLNNPLRYDDPTGNDPRRPRPFDTPWSYILWEMDTNAQSLIAAALAHDNAAGDMLILSRLTTVRSPTSLSLAVEHKKVAYGVWHEQVRYTGDWDHKKPISERWGASWKVPGVGAVDFDAWSNIHYGFVGARAGFLDIELLAGAGVAQLKQSIGKGEEGYRKAFLEGAVGPQTFFDYPEDQRNIVLGIYLWYKYGLDLTEEQFLEELRAWNTTSPAEQSEEQNVNQ